MNKREKYGIHPEAVPGTRPKVSITREGMQQLVKDYPSKQHARIALGTAATTLTRWEDEHQIYWPKDPTPVGKRRIHYDNFTPDGKMLWENRMEAQLSVRNQWEKYTGKTTVFSCSHFPFFAYDRCEEMLDREKGQLGKLVIAGDVVDSYLLSLFRKEYSINPIAEMNSAIHAIKQLKKYATSVLLLTANHDNRFSKRIAEKLSTTEASLLDELVEQLSPGKKLSVINAIGSELAIDTTDYWFIQLGDMFIAHPESALSAPLKTAQRVADYATVRWDNISLVLTGHTHKVGSAIYRKMRVSEIGCMSRLMDYTMAGKIGPMACDLMYVCYNVTNFENGKADISRDGNVYLGPAK